MPLLPARGRVEGHDVEDWLEAERQLEAESMAFSMKGLVAKVATRSN
jgi:hypothetical protein